MNEKAEIRATQSRRKDAFARVALWQFMVFILLICFAWTAEKLDLPAAVFGAETSEFNAYRPLTFTAAIVIAGIIAVGNTYLQQRKIVDRLMTTCLYCHRVQTGENKWEHVEEYFMKNYPVSLNTQACPECRQMLNSIDTPVKDADASPGKAGRA